MVPRRQELRIQDGALADMFDEIFGVQSLFGHFPSTFVADWLNTCLVEATSFTSDQYLLRVDYFQNLKFFLAEMQFQTKLQLVFV